MFSRILVPADNISGRKATFRLWILSAFLSACRYALYETAKKSDTKFAMFSSFQLICLHKYSFDFWLKVSFYCFLSFLSNSSDSKQSILFTELQLGQCGLAQTLVIYTKIYSQPQVSPTLQAWLFIKFAIEKVPNAEYKKVWAQSCPLRNRNPENVRS